MCYARGTRFVQNIASFFRHASQAGGTAQRCRHPSSCISLALVPLAILLSEFYLYVYTCALQRQQVKVFKFVIRLYHTQSQGIQKFERLSNKIEGASGDFKDSAQDLLLL